MAKFLKHFGISNTKKGPPIPPYPDYVKEQQNEELNGQINQREEQLDTQLGLVAETTSCGSGSQARGTDLWIDVNARKNYRTAERVSPSFKGGLNSPNHSSGSGESRRLNSINKRQAQGQGVSAKDQRHSPSSPNNGHSQTKTKTKKV